MRVDLHSSEWFDHRRRMLRSRRGMGAPPELSSCDAISTEREKSFKKYFSFILIQQFFVDTLEPDLMELYML